MMQNDFVSKWFRSAFAAGLLGVGVLAYAEDEVTSEVVPTGDVVEVIADEVIEVPGKKSNEIIYEDVVMISAIDNQPFTVQRIILPEPEPVPEPDFFTRAWPYIWNYLPNRVDDLVDIVTYSVGVGPASSCYVKVTSFGQLGGSYGMMYVMDKGFDRQCGFGRLEVNQAGFMCYDFLEYELTRTTGTLRPCYYEESGKVSLDEYIYLDEHIDPWAVGLGVGVLVNVSAYVHPVEIADFAVGWFGLDISGDDRE